MAYLIKAEKESQKELEDWRLRSLEAIVHNATKTIVFAIDPKLYKLLEEHEKHQSKQEEEGLNVEDSDDPISWEELHSLETTIEEE